MNLLETRELGRTGLRLPVLGFGVASLGELFEKVLETQAQETFEIAYVGGIRYFNPAPLYGHGLSENRLRYLLRQRLYRDFLLSTKVGRVYKLFQATQSTSKEHPGQEDCPAIGVSIFRATVSGVPSRTAPFDSG